MKSLTALLAAAAAALFLSSCSSQAPFTSAAQPARNNAADVTFATDMIPHHQQAVEMSRLVPDRSTDPAVIGLAAEISAAQGPEIETMMGFLTQWDAGHQNHDGAMTGMQMQGMVDDATMTKLESLRGAAFDRLFLQSMIGHHDGAIAMANTELADGANADAKALARKIVTAQQGEMVRMKQMLGGS